MILEIEGNRVQVDDSFGKLDPQQQEAEVAEIAKALAPAAKAPAEDNRVNPMLPTVGAALGAEALGPAVNTASNAYMDTQKLIKGGMPPDVAHNLVRNKYGAVEAWGRQMHSGEFFGGKDFPEAWRLGMEAKYPGGVPSAPAAPVAPIPAGMKAGPAGLAVPQSFEAAAGAAPAAAGAAPKAMGVMAGKAAASPGLQSMKAALGAGISRSVPAVIGRGLAGAGAGFQGVDAYNRAQSGDYGGAAISGLGAIGSAASMIPHPIARVGGTALGIGAEALNAYLDSLKDKNKQGYADGGSVELKSQNSPIGVDIGSGTMGMQAGPYQIPHLAGGGRFGQNGPMTFGVRDIPDYPQEIPQKAKTGGEVKKKTHGPITKDELALIHRLRDHMAS